MTTPLNRNHSLNYRQNLLNCS